MSKRGRLRKTSTKPRTDFALDVRTEDARTELALLCHPDSDSDCDALESMARALKVDIAGWRTGGDEELSRIGSYYTSVQISCDTEWSLQQLRISKDPPSIGDQKDVKKT